MTRRTLSAKRRSARSLVRVADLRDEEIDVARQAAPHRRSSSTLAVTVSPAASSPSSRSEGRARFASLVGEPGVGKTTLVREFRARLPEEVAYRVGRCVSYGRGVTYSPLADVLRAQLGLDLTDPVETVLERRFTLSM